MPIYEYQCGACGALHEALQKVSDDPLVECPACGAKELRKKISAVAFRLKGSGWYETDFKSGDKKNLAGDHGDGAAPGGEGSSPADTASEKKSEKQTEKKSDTGSGAKDGKASTAKAGGGDSAA